MIFWPIESRNQASISSGGKCYFSSVKINRTSWNAERRNWKCYTHEEIYCSTLFYACVSDIRVCAKLVLFCNRIDQVSSGFFISTDYSFREKDRFVVVCIPFEYIHYRPLNMNITQTLDWKNSHKVYNTKLLCPIFL